MSPQAPLFFLKAALAIWGLLCFHMICECFCSSSVKNVIGNLIEIALNLWIAFGSIVIFTVLILPTQEHGISLHLFMSSDFFHQCLIIFCMQFFFLLQFSSVAQLCPALCDPMNRSTLGLPVHHQLLVLTQTHVHWVGDAIQPSHPLPSPSPPALNLSQHQGVSSLHQVAKVLELQLQHQSFQWIFRVDFL